MNYIQNLKDKAVIHGDEVQVLSSHVLSNPKFATWIGGMKHHNGHGGLAKHTYEVVELCGLTSSNYHHLDINPSTLFLAALFHDVGKIWDYEEIWDMKGKRWVYTKHQKQVHHIMRSAVEWTKACKEHNSEKYEEEVLHAILAHHGSKQYGSMVEPQTPLAFVLYVSDMTSAMMDQFIPKLLEPRGL